MTVHAYRDYLETDYLSGAYAGGEADAINGVQVNLVITDFPNPIGAQANLVISDFPNPLGAQANLTINDDNPIGAQVDRQIAGSQSLGSQVDLSVTTDGVFGSQVTLTVTDDLSIGAQVLRQINQSSPVGSQVNRIITGATKFVGAEVLRDFTIAHWLCGPGYLGDDGGGGYLTGPAPYLAPRMCAQMGFQVLRQVDNSLVEIGAQVNRVIADQPNPIGLQVQLVIADYPYPVGAQVDRLRRVVFGMQVRFVLYNTTNLRVLCDFPSRGTTGTNWTATSTDTGDFDVNNVNTDIVEERWQSAAGITSATLTCDTEIVQGTTIDTLALLDHNLTTSAVVTLEGSDNGAFSPVGYSEQLNVQVDNLIHIADVFPTAQHRYWRLVISDPTNPDSQLQIGTIVFGNSIILQGECFTDRVIRRRVHYKDEVFTEGFSNVSNDRAVKRAVELDFRFLAYQGGNYENLNDVFLTAKTSLKCLWIPFPPQVERFSVFGKLTEIPEEVHEKYSSDDSSDWVSFQIEIDESK